MTTTKENIKQKVSSKLKIYMRQRNLKQRDLALLLGVTQGSLSYYINGQQEPSPNVLVRIADLVDCSLGELLRTDN